MVGRKQKVLKVKDRIFELGQLANLANSTSKWAFKGLPWFEMFEVGGFNGGPFKVVLNCFSQHCRTGFYGNWSSQQEELAQWALPVNTMLIPCAPPYENLLGTETGKCTDDRTKTSDPSGDCAKKYTPRWVCFEYCPLPMLRPGQYNASSPLKTIPFITSLNF